MNPIFLVAIFALLLSSCASENDKFVDSSNKKYGKIFRVNIPDEFPATYFPPNASVRSSIQTLNVAYETLLKYSSDGQTIEGLLAKSWDINEAGDEYTIHLRENVYFHDDDCFENEEGRELKSNDVAYCFTQLCTPNPLNRNSGLISERIQGGMDRIENKNGSSDQKYLSGIEIIDDYTLKIKLVGPSYSFINYLTHYATSIYPEEAVMHYGEEIKSHMVGTGPFKFKTSVPGKTVIFIRNSNYWMADEEDNPLPYLDGVKYTYETDVYKLNRVAKENRLDLLLDPSQKTVSAVNIIEENDSSNTGFRLRHSDAWNINYFSFLQTDSIFNDLKVRQAFNHAIDRQFIVDSVLAGFAETQNYGIIPKPFTDYIDPEGYEYNPTKARKLLQEAGYNDQNKFPFQTLHVTTSEDHLSIAQAIQKMLSENLNVYTDVSALDQGSHYEKFDAGKLPFAADGWNADYFDVDNFLSLYVSYLTPEKGGFNLSRFNNEAFDEYYQKGLDEFDKAKRIEYFSKANTILYENAALVPLYTGKRQALVSSRTNNLMPIVGQKINLSRLYLSN